MTFREVIACLDGSLYAEKILPYAHAIAAPSGAKLTLLRVVENEAELQAAENYLRERAGRWGAEVAVKIAKVGAADSIVGVLRQNPDAIPAITTHGRSALLEMLAMTSRARAGLEEAVFGSVTSECVRRAGVPILVYWPAL